MIQSYCMAFNEAEWIERSVKSALRVADICTVFDNGSTDGTPDMARDAGAEVVSLPPQEGVDYNDARFNHRERRNECISRLRGDWILNLDADEELWTRNASMLRHLIVSYPAVVAFTFRRFELWCSERFHRVDWSGYYPWLWQNGLGIRYGTANPPHEELVYADRTALQLGAQPVKEGDVHIRHYHYVRGWKAERHLKSGADAIKAVEKCYEMGKLDPNVRRVPWAK